MEFSDDIGKLQRFMETGVTIGVTEVQKSFTESLRKS